VKLTPDFVDTFYIAIELKRVTNLSVRKEIDAEGFQEVIVILVLIDVVLHVSNTKKTVSDTTNQNKQGDINPKKLKMYVKLCIYNKLTVLLS